MSDMLLKGSVEKNNIRYKWVTEPNACKKCQEMEGRLFNSVEEFEAARPHPHCKCSYEVIIEPPEKVVQNVIQQQDLIKDTADLKEELEVALHEYKRALDTIELQEEILNDQLAKKHLLSTMTINEISKVKDKLAIDKEDVIKIIKQITEALVEVKNIEAYGLSGNVENRALTDLYNKLKAIKLNLQKFFILDGGISLFGNFGLSEGAGLWQIASSKLDPKKSYLKKNGEVLKSFIDIEEPNVRTEVKEKLESQHMTLKSRGVRFRHNSSIAEKIVNSTALKKYFRENNSKFKFNTHLPKYSFPFSPLKDPDLFSAIHNTDMVDIYIDFYENFTAKIIDTYDFNEGEKYFLVQMGNAQQKAENIETYFIIVDIIIPKEIWEQY